MENRPGGVRADISQISCFFQIQKNQKRFQKFKFCSEYFCSDLNLQFIHFMNIRRHFKLKKTAPRIEDLLIQIGALGHFFSFETLDTRNLTPPLIS